MKLKLGVIGLSDGNGHPFSWGAIFNGYNPDAMENCGFPVIPRYLEQQKWPESQIDDAEVIAVWTQDKKISNQIAEAVNIAHVVSRPEDMIGLVDAVLLARDDAENHLRYAAEFLKAGLPIYIDKPVALSIDSFEKLYDLEQYPGQIFTCSALRYSGELTLSVEDFHSIGEIRNVVAYTPKSWDKYAVHIIEPVLNMLPRGDRPLSFHGGKSSMPVNGDSGSLIIRWASGIETAFFATGDGMTPITIRVLGNKGYIDLNFSDSFSAFKAALQAFVHGIRNKEIASPKAFNEIVVQIIERGALCDKQF